MNMMKKVMILSLSLLSNAYLTSIPTQVIPNLITQCLQTVDLCVSGTASGIASALPFAYVTDTTVQNDLFLGDSVTFNQAGFMTSEFSHTAGSSDITINADGTYAAFFTLIVLGDLGHGGSAAFQFFLDGVAVPLTIYPVAVQTLNGNEKRMSAFAIFDIAEGQVLSLRVADNSDNLAGLFVGSAAVANSVSAAITLIKIV
jgi:hypothetical protein